MGEMEDLRDGRFWVMGDLGDLGDWRSRSADASAHLAWLHGRLSK